MESFPKLIKIVPYILAIGIGVILFLNYDSRAKRAIEKTKLDFPLLTRQEPLNERVNEIYCPREIRCGTPPIFVILASGEKRSINVKERTDSTIGSLVSVFSVGDSLVKKSNNDTVFVYYNGAVGSFLIH